MAQQFFGGTIQTLANLIQQQKAQNLAKETPQWQSAVFNLMRAKEQDARLAAFREQIAQGNLTPSQIAQQGAGFFAGEGNIQPAMTLQGQEFEAQEARERIPIQGEEQRKISAAKLYETFEGLIPSDVDYFNKYGNFPEEAIPRLKVRQKPMSSFDPFTRAYQAGLGRAAAVAETETLPAAESIVGDLGMLFGHFDAIDEKFKGPLAGRTTGFAARAFDTNVQTYESIRQLNLSNILKGLAKEVGVLTDTDIRRVKMAQPEMWDTPGTVKNKKIFMYNYIDQRVRAAQKVARRPITGINIPAEYRIENFNINAVQSWEKGGIPAKETRIPLNEKASQQQQIDEIRQQVEGQGTTQQGDEVDNYLNNLGL